MELKQQLLIPKQRRPYQHSRNRKKSWTALLRKTE